MVKLELTQVAVVAPLLASIAGVTYDVGYFYGIDINYFTFFSFSEHVLFALEDLPIALLLIAPATAYIVMRDAAGSELVQAHKQDPVGSDDMQVKRLLFSVVLSLLATLGLLISDGLNFLGLCGVFALFFSLCGGLVPGIFRTLRSNLSYLTFAVFVSTFLGAFGDARRDLAGSSKPDILALRDFNIEGRILRSGDRGVLFHDSAVNQIVLVPWNKIAQVSSKK